MGPCEQDLTWSKYEGRNIAYGICEHGRCDLLTTAGVHRYHQMAMKAKRCGLQEYEIMVAHATWLAGFQFAKEHEVASGMLHLMLNVHRFVMNQY